MSRGGRIDQYVSAYPTQPFVQLAGQNPWSFWQSLEWVGIRTHERETFQALGWSGDRPASTSALPRHLRKPFELLDRTDALNLSRFGFNASNWDSVVNVLGQAEVLERGRVEMEEDRVDSAEVYHKEPEYRFRRREAEEAEERARNQIRTEALVAQQLQAIAESEAKANEVPEVQPIESTKSGEKTMANEIAVKDVTPATAATNAIAKDDLTKRAETAFSTFLAELTAIAKESGVRAGLRSGVKLVHDPIVDALAKNAKSADTIEFIRQSFGSDAGLALTGIILSFVVRALPWKTDKTQAIVHELRVEAGSKVLAAPLEFLLGPVKDGLSALLMFAGDTEAAQGVKDLTPETLVQAVATVSVGAKETQE